MLCQSARTDHTWPFRPALSTAVSLSMYAATAACIRPDFAIVSAPPAIEIFLRISVDEIVGGASFSGTPTIGAPKSPVVYGAAVRPSLGRHKTPVRTEMCLGILSPSH